MTAITSEMLHQRLENLEQIPSLPVALTPLLHYLEQPLERVEVDRVVDLISQDKSLAAQCLHVANSPLFGHWRNVDSIRGAVVALGMQRMRDIVLSCSLLKIPSPSSVLDPARFWEHSLGCALVSRRFAKRVGFADPGKAYLAGLLHDLGVLVNLWLLPEQFARAFELARTAGIPLHEAELSVLGLTHARTGSMLAQKWQLTSDLVEVIACHHELSAAPQHCGLAALVSLSDLLCRMSGLGHGFVEQRQINFGDELGFAVLLKECPGLRNFDWARLTFELEGYLDEVQRLVALLYRPQ